MAEENKTDGAATASAEAPPPPPSSAKKTMIMIFGVILLIILGAIGYFFMMQKPVETADMKAAKVRLQFEEKLKKIRYLTVPDLLVNLKSHKAEGGSTFVRISVVLELTDPKDLKPIKELLPQIVNQFQIYLRGLEVDDIKGTEGVERLRSNLLARVNRLTDPLSINNVLIKDLLVQ
jgi:flagellar FliL protein